MNYQKKLLSALFVLALNPFTITLADQLPPGLNDLTTTTTPTVIPTSSTTVTPVTPTVGPVTPTTKVSPATPTTASSSTSYIAAPTKAFDDFKDVPVTHPNYNAIIVLRYQGVFKGYSDNTFHPDQELNRVEALKLIYEVFEPTIALGIAPAKFEDTKEDSWYAGYLNKAVFNEVVTGYSDGTFKPEKPVTLVEFMKMLLIAQKVDLSKTYLSQIAYADVMPGQWYTKYINYAKINNLLATDQDNKVFPGKALTRAKAAEILYRFKNSMLKSKALSNISTDSKLGYLASPLKVTDYALYVSTSYKFALQYPKKWFYASLESTDKAAIRTYGFGPKDLSVNPPIVTLTLLPLDKNFQTNLVNGSFNYLRTERDGLILLSAKIEGSSRIYQLSGNSDQEQTMLTMLSSLTTDIEGQESFNPAEKTSTPTTVPSATTPVSTVPTDGATSSNVINSTPTI